MGAFGATSFALGQVPRTPLTRMRYRIGASGPIPVPIHSPSPGSATNHHHHPALLLLPTPTLILILTSSLSTISLCTRGLQLATSRDAMPASRDSVERESLKPPTGVTIQLSGCFGPRRM